MHRESLENLGRTRFSEKHVRLVFAKEARESQYDEFKAERLMAAIGHHLEDVIALLRQRNTSTLCCPWRSSRDRTIQVKAERLMATTGQLFEELMATFHTLGIADPPLELHVLDVPGAHCLTVFMQGNVAASRKQVAPALITFFEKAERC